MQIDVTQRKKSKFWPAILADYVQNESCGNGDACSCMTDIGLGRHGRQLWATSSVYAPKFRILIVS